jgi:nucleoside-diphosphate-sugar epimerase
MSNSTALVTGANGFVGSHLCDRLSQSGYRVKALVRKTSNLRFLEKSTPDLVYGDLSDPDALNEILEDVNYVFHPAGLVRARTRKIFFKVNQIGTRNLLEAVKKSAPNLKRFVHISSQAAAGPSQTGIPVTEENKPTPVSAYGESKLASEEEVLHFKDNIPVTIIRPPAVYGPRDSDVYKFYKIAKAGLNIRIGMAQPHISLVHVADLVDCIVKSAESDTKSGEIFFAANAQNHSMNEIIHSIADILGKQVIDIAIPVTCARTIAFIVENVYEILRKPAPFSRDKIKELSYSQWTCSPCKAERILGWKAQIQIRDGLEMTHRWYKEKGWL